MNHNLSNKKITVAPDILDKLPDDIVSRILKCLPLHDAAKLCLLSRSWLYAWKGLPELRFDAEFFAEVLKGKTPTAEKLCNILSVILLSHVGPINGFYLCVPRLKSSIAPNIGPCISSLSRNSVKAITIKNVKEPLMLSYHLFSCLNLEKLTLDNCVFNVLPFSNVLKKLKSMELEQVIIMGNSFSKFIASCPVLESLTLKQCRGFEHIYIAAPNLKYLTASGLFESVYLRFAKNLIGFSVTLEKMIPNNQSGKTCELIAYLAHQCRLEYLSFGGHFCKLLTAGEIGKMFPIYYHSLKSLELCNIKTNDRDELFWVIGMVKCCPVLEDLKISFLSKYCAEHKIEFDSGHRFYRLRKVHLTSVMGVVLELRLIEFLLRCSPALETMCVKRDAKITQALESRLTRSLMYYCRASPEATVVYVEV
ncbi:hypothetical protein RND81_12G054800 [Saponaria officinalis]|uniref:F-box domain-containing protein n=1 Tax=Saponaria officinalis TaxID=3572 RepID=A0AAW1H7A5_SAPOF